MSKLTSVDFARLWEAIPKLNEKQWNALKDHRAEYEIKAAEQRVKKHGQPTP